MADDFWGSLSNVDTEDVVKLGLGIYGLTQGNNGSRKGSETTAQAPSARTPEASAMWNVYMDRVLGPGWQKYSGYPTGSANANQGGVLNSLTQQGRTEGGGNERIGRTGASSDTAASDGVDLSNVNMHAVGAAIAKYGRYAIGVVAPQLLNLYDAASSVINDLTGSDRTGGLPSMYEQGGYKGLGIGNPSSYTHHSNDGNDGRNSDGPSHAGTGPGGSGGGFSGHESSGL